MNETTFLQAWVEGIGLLGPGLTDWPQARAVLTGQAPYTSAPTVLPAPERLPSAERRRASPIIKVTLAAGLQACRAAGREPSELTSVFASSGGDGNNCHQICALLAADERQISPTRFHNSVHNAACGYWSIATGATSAAQVLGAYDASFGAGLLEAMTQVAAGGEPVLLVAGDSGYPEPLHAKRPIADTGALALVLAPARTPASLALLRLPLHGALAEGVPSALPAHLPEPLHRLVQTMPPMRGLALVAALAGVGQGRAALQTVAVEYLPPQVLQVQVLP
ncbi:MAG: beta-ketoacyl synthase chain length factor [Burkholderiaceae bacterium]|jgi:hypothetical protein|nr:beta-ketoacyl synthase chain length factor [Burkholderiaceae bacterium]